MEAKRRHLDLKLRNLSPNMAESRWRARTYNARQLEFDWYRVPTYYDIIFDEDSDQETDLASPEHGRYWNAPANRRCQTTCDDRSHCVYYALL